MTTSLVLRPLPFRAGLDLILAEAAALVAFGLERGCEVGNPTWLRFEPEAKRLTVAIEIHEVPEPLPEGLDRAVPPAATGTPVELDLDRLRSGPDRWIRIEHDPISGRPIAALAHPVPDPTR